MAGGFYRLVEKDKRGCPFDVAMDVHEVHNGPCESVLHFLLRLHPFNGEDPTC